MARSGQGRFSGGSFTLDGEHDCEMVGVGKGARVPCLAVRQEDGAAQAAACFRSGAGDQAVLPDADCMRHTLSVSDSPRQPCAEPGPVVSRYAPYRSALRVSALSDRARERVLSPLGIP